MSLAGRVDRPIRQPLPQRIGGFGGPDGLSRYLTENQVTHVIDATHPFAAQMSRNTVQACQASGVPLAAFTRPPWQERSGDDWQRVPDIPAAVDALDQKAIRVFLAVGRMHLADFAPNPQHHYVLRLVDPPKGDLPFPDAEVIVDRGPFQEADDLALLRSKRVDLVVSKNSGGTAAYAKIAAARTLQLPVLMIDRPVLPKRLELTQVPAVLDWVRQHDTDLGV